MSDLQFSGKLLIHVYVYIQPTFKHLPSLLSCQCITLGNGMPNPRSLQLVHGLGKISISLGELIFQAHALVPHPYDTSFQHLLKG